MREKVSPGNTVNPAIDSPLGAMGDPNRTQFRRSHTPPAPIIRIAATASVVSGLSGRANRGAPASLRTIAQPMKPTARSARAGPPEAFVPTSRPTDRPNRATSSTGHARRDQARAMPARTLTNPAANQRSAAPTLLLRNIGVENSNRHNHEPHARPECPVIVRKIRFSAATISANGRSIARSMRSGSPVGTMNQAATMLPAIG